MDLSRSMAILTIDRIVDILFVQRKNVIVAPGTGRLALVKRGLIHHFRKVFGSIVSCHAITLWLQGSLNRKTNHSEDNQDDENTERMGPVRHSISPIYNLGYFTGGRAKSDLYCILSRLHLAKGHFNSFVI